jgi:hypothetical protein
LKSGIVMQINKRKATLLMKDGTFVTVKIPKGKTPLVGKEYQASYFIDKKRSLFVLPSLSLTASTLAAVIFLSGLMPFGNHSAVAAYVSFDINPSLEVGVNDEMKVVHVEPFNDEARDIIDEYNLSSGRELTFVEFADKLIEAYEEEGYMLPDHSMLITTVSSDEEDEKAEEELDEAVQSVVRHAAVNYPVSITVTETTADSRKKAKKLGVSAGKYSAFQKSVKKENPITDQQIKEVSIQEIQKKMTTTPKDIKVVPHPRKIESPSHEFKKEKKPKNVSLENEKNKKINHNHQHNISQSMDKKASPIQNRKATQNVKGKMNYGQEKKIITQEKNRQKGKIKSNKKEKNNHKR